MTSGHKQNPSNIGFFGVQKASKGKPTNGVDDIRSQILDTTPQNFTDIGNYRLLRTTRTILKASLPFEFAIGIETRTKEADALT